MDEWFLETPADSDVSLCFQLNETREYTIGRRKGYDIVSPNPLVSRKHGVITLKSDGRIYIRDLKSANGTYINDEIIEPHTDCLLNSNDLLGIGAPTTAGERKKEIFWVRRRLKRNAIVSTETESVDHVPGQCKSENAEHGVAFTSTVAKKEQNYIEYAEQVVASTSKTSVKFEDAEQIVQSTTVRTAVSAQVRTKNVEPVVASISGTKVAQIKSKNTEQVVEPSRKKILPAQIRSKHAEQLGTSTKKTEIIPKVKKNDSICVTNDSDKNITQESRSSKCTKIFLLKTDTNTSEAHDNNTKSTNEYKSELNNICANKKISTETSNSRKNESKSFSLDEEDKKDVLIKSDLKNKKSSNDSSNLSVNNKDSYQNGNDNSTLNKSVENKRKTQLIQKLIPENNIDKVESDYLQDKNNIIPNDTTSSNEDVKLGVDYLNSIIEKNTHIEIDLCNSSDEDDVIIEHNNLNITAIKSKPNISDIKNESFEKNLQVKTEPENYIFSQNNDDSDILIISDDEDIFPSSQLFDVSVKQERVENLNPATTGNTSPTSDDNNEEINQDIFSNIKNEQNYDYNNENDDDDDDDCIVWYSKLSQSQDFISARRKIEPSPDESDEADADKDDFIIFNDKELAIFEKDIQKPDDEDCRKSRAASTDIEENEHAQSKDYSDEDELEKSKYVQDQDSGLVDKSFPSTSKFDEKENETSFKKKTETKKSYVKPPLIDAPFLRKGKRKAHEETKSKDKYASVIKKRKSSPDEIPPAPTSVNSAIQSSVVNKSLKIELDKRNKKRRKSVDAYSKDEKIKIQEDRKKKLKELASKSVDNKKKEEVQKNHTKPKVKVSSSRGLFLTGPEPAQTTSKKKSEGPPEEEPVTKKFKIPKRSYSFSCEPSTSKTNTDPKPNFAKINKLSFNDLNLTKPSKTKSKESNTSKINNVPELRKEKKSVERSHSISSYNTTNKFKGILLHPERVRKPKQRVTFKEGHDVRYIEKLPGNRWRKVTVKDAPVPDIHNIRETEEIISTVLEWRPAWLEEQKGKNISPQVSKRTPLRMLTNFNTIGDYFSIVQPLMLLELWKSVYRDWCTSNADVKLACIEKIVHKDTSTFITCYCLADRTDVDLPKYGDLILTEYYLINIDSRIGTNKNFGYVLYANKRRMIPTDVVHKQFCEMGPVPPFKLTFTMQIKRSQAQILDEKLMRIRFVSRIAPPLRIFKSVSYLNNSPLRNLILKPSVQQYKITKPSQMNSVIVDNLNSDQMMCVYEAYQICTRDEPGIYLIQGPPGTGKSFLIKNLVRQLLYGVAKNAEKPHILLCAPSNGAVDEITNTLLDMRCKLSKNDRFKMIRIGPPNAIVNPKVKSISVPQLVSKYMQAKQNNNLKTNSYMTDEYEFLIKKENTLKNKISSMEARKIDYSIDLHNLRKVQVQIEQLKSKSNLFQERRRQEKDSETYLLENADIICTTLSSCISACSRLEELVAEKKITFTCCIIDEATQSHEQESLIPLILGIQKFVLVGDPQQLPPTTISQEAKYLGYGNSLFNRIKSCFDHLPDNPIRMLTHQYRMHNEICKFPSNNFYGGRLQTATAVLNRHDNILHPYRLFSLNTSKNFKENEYLNKTEANLVLLLTDIVTSKTRYNVGIITPYTRQKEYLTDSYRAMRAKENKENLEKDEDRHLSRVVINTVDGFQGQERDVIIISSVRYKSNIFLNDLQRLNVALTRAKHAVFICAHSDLFKTESIWKQLERDANNRNCSYLISDRDTTNEKYMSELILKHSTIY